MKIPKNYFQINIAQGVALGKIPEMERIERECQILSILTFRPASEFEQMERGKLLKLIEKTKWVGNDQPQGTVKPFRYGWHVFKFKTQARQLSQQEFVLLQKFQDDPMGNLHKTMAILAKRKWAKKDPIEEFEFKCNLFEQRLPFGMAIAYTLFFSLYYPILQQITLSYLQGQQRAIKEAMEM